MKVWLVFMFETRHHGPIFGNSYCCLSGGLTLPLGVELKNTVVTAMRGNLSPYVNGP